MRQGGTAEIRYKFKRFWVPTANLLIIWHLNGIDISGDILHDNMIGNYRRLVKSNRYETSILIRSLTSHDEGIYTVSATYSNEKEKKYYSTSASSYLRVEGILHYVNN